MQFVLDAGGQLFRMETVKNQKAADQRISTEIVDDPRARLACLKHDFEESLEPSPMEVHEQLNEFLRAGTDGRVGDGFQIMNQLADLLYSLLEIPIVDH